MTADDETVPHPETTALIASDKLQAIRVYSADGGKIGGVNNFMVEKRTGQVAYVVVSTGGFLGLGQAYHPLPWSALKYDDGKEGYVLQITGEMLAGGPSYRPDSAPTFDQEYGRRLDDYYKLRPVPPSL